MLVKSEMIALGTVAPPFNLPDSVSGDMVSFDSFPNAKGYLVAFLCNHCPFVVRIGDVLGQMTAKWQAKGISVIGISVNDVSTHPEDSPEKMKEFAHRHNWIFPYCFDESQKSAKDYSAVCTPDFFLFDSGPDRKLVYRGRFDASTPGNTRVCDGSELDHAIEMLLIGERVPDSEQRPSIGCSIKWKE